MINKYLLFTFLITAALSSKTIKTNAQNQPLHEKKSFVDSLNRIYTQTSLPIYLFVSNKPDGSDKIPMSQNYSETTKNKVEPMYLDGNGKHHIKHYDEIEKIPVTFVIFADGTAPQTKLIFEKNKPFFKNGKKFFANNQKITLSSTDDMSGKQQTYYSIDSAEYLPYTKALEISSQGDHILKYYSVDNVGNAETPKEERFTIDGSTPQTFYNITNVADSNVVSQNSVIYFTPEDNNTGVAKTYFRIDSMPEKIYTPGKIYIKNLSEGYHTIYYYSVDNTGNKEPEKNFTFYLDKTAPIVATDILGDKYVVGDKIFFSGKTKLKLTAIDNKSGVKEVKYSIDGSQFYNYQEPFYLPNEKGIHIIDYYAVDKLENRTMSMQNGKYLEYIHFVSSIYVDLTGPTLNHKITGKYLYTRDTLFINHQTKIELSQFDPESGAKKITYSLNRNAEEIEYTQPLSFAEEGYHEINQIGYDNVNNRNFKTLSFVVDKKGPEIFYKYSVNPISKTDSVETYPYFVAIFLAPTDNLSGIETVSYSVNDMPLKTYTSKIAGFNRGQKNKVKIIVTDNLGNKTEEEIIFEVEK